MTDLKDVAIKLLWHSGLGKVLCQPKANDRLVLVFHGISSKRRPDIPRHIQPWHSAEELTLVLSWLAKRFQFLTPELFFEGIQPGILLTFDDGLANNYLNALPILERFNAPAIFFVSTQHIANPRNWLLQMREKARRYWGSESEVPESIAAEFFDGMSAIQLAACGAHPLLTIGAHTVSHPLLSHCNDDQLKYELEKSRQFLQDISNQAVESLAYPTGDYDNRVMKAAELVGFQSAFAVKNKRLGLPQFEIERTGIYKSYPAYLSMKLS